MSAGPVVVVGDALLDVDLVGSAERLAPDAAVPVIDEIHESARPGGAALAATLLARDGADVILITGLGHDATSARLREAVPATVRLLALPIVGELPRKVRVRAGAHSLARLDYGDSRLDDNVDAQAAHALFAQASAILVSDYGRGVAARLRDLVERFTSHVPVVWDPHPRGAKPAPGVAVVTPNLDEATRVARVAGSSPRADLAYAAHCACQLVSAWRAKSVCVTMGARGALLSFGAGSPLVVPAPKVRCHDPCGAGDRFASTLTSALARGALPSQGVRAAVLAASAFVEHGVANVLADRGASTVDGDVFAQVAAVRRKGGAVVATGGCFDLLHAGHVETLRAARALGDYLVVCLNSDASVTRLKGPGRPLMSAADRRRVLEALECVDAVVIFDEDTPSAVLEKLRPRIWAKGGDYGGRTLPEEAVLSRWGGHAVVLPYLPGHSTTALVTTMESKTLAGEGVWQ